uniref:ATP-dependent DNA helicase n=1 Tax=Tanacetum cinerariifolium TaxID=118510 RepID=A0A6L2NTK7_TANCI|nr:DNA helicase [Tanacetum cinerariifolium]
MNPNNPVDYDTYDHYDVYFQSDYDQYTRDYEAYEHFVALCEQEAGGSSSDPKRRRTYIPHERETAEQRLLEDYHESWFNGLRLKNSKRLPWKSRPSPCGGIYSVGRVVDGRHIGNINDAGLCSSGNVIDDVGCGFHVDEFIGTRGLQTLVASSSANRKRIKYVMYRTTTSNVGSSSSTTRRGLHSGRHNANTSVSNDDSVFLADTSNVHTNDYSLRGNRTGRVVLRTYEIYPEYIQLLLWDHHFMKNIRAYNQVFSMTSLGARVDDSINVGRGPYAFKFSGQLYHWLGSLCPVEGDPPKFLQLYVYDTENELDNRMAHFGGDNSGLRRDIVEEVPPFKVRLFNVVGAREYELPIGDMLGAIVYELGPNAEMDFDIVIEQRIGQPQRVSKLHPSYMALQFPLLFVYDEDGYSKDMKMVRVSGVSSDEDRRLTIHTCFMIVIDYIRDHQNDIRNDYLSGIYDAIRREDSDGSDCGGRLILPQSFTGGPRYMYIHYLDALAICRVHRNPTYFITFTLWIDEASGTQNQEEIDNYISAELPSEKVDPEVLAVASSGIASLLLPSRHTTHSRFKLPLDVNDSSVCSVTKNTQLATLLKEIDLIVLDESSINDWQCFETLDRTLQDILDTPTNFFGGKPIMLGGDFRQTLTTQKKEVSTFAERLLNVGDGTLGVPDDTDPANTSWIEIPAQFKIPDDENDVTKLINFIYDEHTLLHPTAKDLQDKEIVCPKNAPLDVINAKIMNMLLGHNTTYISNDEAMPYEHDVGEVKLLYPTEYLNTLNFAGIPPHELNLKIGTPIMLLRNINIIDGLCNGTHMIIKQLLPKVIEAQIINGTRISQKAYIPRIPLTMKDPKLPFIFKRK